MIPYGMLIYGAMNCESLGTPFLPNSLNFIPLCLT